MSDQQIQSPPRPQTSHILLSPFVKMSQTEDSSPQLYQSAAPTHQVVLPGSNYIRSFPKFHQHTISDSTNTIGSNDSSPTTTISTVDDSSATEPSPGSSPESPPPTTFAVGMIRPRTADESRGSFFELQKQPPPRKGRNLKNLAVNTSGKPVVKSIATGLPQNAPAETDATVLSPSFVKPPTPPRRKTANLGLTILTPGLSKAPPQEIRLAIPPTPGFSKPATLRHFQSSPSLPFVSGFDLQPISPIAEKRRPQPLDTLFSPLKESFPIQEEEEQNFDIPLSREEKPEAYPDGPICVYDPKIDLYLEPTADQARRYDVIFNVASEVRNPFVELVETPAFEPELRIDGGGGIQYAPKRDNLAPTTNTAATNMKQEGSPTTPKATQSPDSAMENEPEYIHIPWEHNSDIVPDLYRLCKLMDDRVNEGKRVLVHCQCGVSRSASLVVAYGLYKQPSLSVQQAYDTVKGRSKWIGPNMNLIMQLQEFRSSLANGGRLASNRCSGMSPITPSSAFSEWRSPFSMRPSSISSQEVPMTAGAAPKLEPRASSTDLGSIGPGPSSAPSGMSWPTADSSARNPLLKADGAQTPAALVNPSGHVLPLRNYNGTDNGFATAGAERFATATENTPSITVAELPVSPRGTEFAMAPLKPTTEVDSADSFGLMSPTSMEFSSSLFDRSALLASLGMGSMGRDEDTPRRSLSLRSKELLQQRDRDRDQARERERDQARLNAPLPPPPSKLRPLPLRRLQKKISAPSLREQEQLQTLQAKIKASLPLWKSNPKLSTVDEALMSPRATEFTKNPFALTLPDPAGRASGVLRPRTSDGADPRSPAHSGANPITRNILDVL